MEIFTSLIIFQFKLNPDQRPNVQFFIDKIESVKSDVMSDSSVQNAWESLQTRINNGNIRVDRNTMGSRDLVKELTQMNLNAQNEHGVNK